uniref:PTB domain-containing engulfment adapter protein 1 n=1 Tax=Hydra vulgaris TaxID=6087 RepID=T2M3D6_HYDVU
MDKSNPQKRLQTIKKFQEGFVVFRAKYLGCIPVQKSKGVEVIKEAIRKLKIAHQLKKSEAGIKESKLMKVEIHISMNWIKIINSKSKVMVCNRPLHRVSYCADDNTDKKIFSFIAKDQESNTHSCFVLKCEKEATDLTLTFGEAFDLAYKRYIQTEKEELKKNKELINISAHIEEFKKENPKFQKGIEASTLLSSPRQMDEPLTRTVPLSASARLSSTLLEENLVKENTSENVITDNARFLSNIENSSYEVFQDASAHNHSSLNDFDWFNYSNSNNNAMHSRPFDHNVDPSIVDQLQDSKVSDSGLSNTDFFDFLSKSPSEQDFALTNDPFADNPHWNNVVKKELSISESFDNDVLNLPTNPFRVNSDQSCNNMYSQNGSARLESETKESDSFSQFLSSLVGRTENLEINNNSDQFSSGAFFNSFETNFDENGFKATNEINLSFETLNSNNLDLISPSEIQTSSTPRNDLSSIKCENSRPRPTGNTLKGNLLPAPPSKKTMKVTTAVSKPITPIAAPTVRSNSISTVRNNSIPTERNNSIPTERNNSIPADSESISNARDVKQSDASRKVNRLSVGNIAHILPNVEKAQSPNTDFRSRSRSSVSAKKQYSLFQVSKTLEGLETFSYDLIA